jgi:hypothetical protein
MPSRHGRLLLVTIVLAATLGSVFTGGPLFGVQGSSGGKPNAGSGVLARDFFPPAILTERARVST